MNQKILEEVLIETHKETSRRFDKIEAEVKKLLRVVPTKKTTKRILKLYDKSRQLYMGHNLMKLTGEIAISKVLSECEKKYRNCYVIIPCPEHGFKPGYVLCSYCRDMREAVDKKLTLVNTRDIKTLLKKTRW